MFGATGDLSDLLTCHFESNLNESWWRHDLAESSVGIGIASGKGHAGLDSAWVCAWPGLELFPRSKGLTNDFTKYMCADDVSALIFHTAQE